MMLSRGSLIPLETTEALLGSRLSYTGEEEANMHVASFGQGRVALPRRQGEAMQLASLLDDEAASMVRSFESNVMYTPEEWENIRVDLPTYVPFMDRVLSSNSIHRLENAVRQPHHCLSAIFGTDVRAPFALPSTDVGLVGVEFRPKFSKLRYIGKNVSDELVVRRTLPRPALWPQRRFEPVSLSGGRFASFAGAGGRLPAALDLCAHTSGQLRAKLWPDTI